MMVTNGGVRNLYLGDLFFFKIWETKLKCGNSIIYVPYIMLYIVVKKKGKGVSSGFQESRPHKSMRSRVQNA